MRWWLVLVALLTAACGDDGSGPAVDDRLAEQARPSEVPIGELEFHDEQLQAIATNLLRSAQARGLTSVRSDGNAAERLIALEAELGAPPAALARVNALVLSASSTDASEWAILRAKAQTYCESRDDDPCQRVTDLVQRWQMQKSKVITDRLHGQVLYRYGGIEWEQFFLDFIRKKPRDVATWGWMILRDREAELRKQYGEADAEHAFRYYLAITRLGKPHEAANAFSVPGIEID